MRKTVWTFGLIAGAILSVMMLVTIPLENGIGFDRAEIVGYTSMVVAFLLIFFRIRSYRDNVGGGRISFGRALAVGSLITVVASACYVATWEVIYYKITPDFFTKYQAYKVDQAKAKGATQAEIDKQLADMKQFAELYEKNPLVNVAVTFVEPLPVALLITLVSAGVLSRRRRLGPVTGVAALSSQ